MKFLSVFLFVILVLCTPFINGQTRSVSGRSNNLILANGDPPLTAKTVEDLAELFEWALNGKFSDDQRQRLAGLLILEWQSGPKNAIDDTMRLSELGAALSGLTDRQRNDIQPRVQAMLLDAIRNNPVDPVSELLQAVFGSGPAGRHGPDSVLASVVQPQQTEDRLWESIVCKMER